MRRSAGIVAVATLSTVALALSAAPANAAAADHSGTRLSLTSVSNPKPSLVSGGDVLIRVTGSSQIPTLTVDGRTAGRDRAVATGRIVARAHQRSAQRRAPH